MRKESKVRAKANIIRAYVVYLIIAYTANIIIAYS